MNLGQNSYAGHVCKVAASSHAVVVSPVSDWEELGGMDDRNCNMIMDPLLYLAARMWNCISLSGDYDSTGRLVL